VRNYLELVDRALAKARVSTNEKSRESDERRSTAPHNDTGLSRIPLARRGSLSIFAKTYAKNKIYNDINEEVVFDGCDCDSQSKNQKISDEKSEKNQLELAFETLCARPPEGVLNQRWIKAITDAEDFLVVWGEQAAALGWTVDDLFGLDPIAPLRRHDAMGLLWSLQGCKVVALTELAAIVRMPTGNLLTFYRRNV
jgi:hypothetical protein